MIVFKDYSVDRTGEMRHFTEYDPDEWANARDRRSKRRSENDSGEIYREEKVL
jgi:mannose-1-phosphate guanylyltransferase